MKQLLIVAICLSASFALAADTVPTELVAARTRYDAALALTTKPVREKYIQELQQLKNRALTMKNLELAVAIDQEIKTVSVASLSSTKTAVAGRPLSELLPGTTWRPEREVNKWKSISFTTDGQIARTDRRDNTQRTSYEITKDGDNVQFKWSAGSIGILHFTRGNRQFEFDGSIFKQATEQ